MCSDHAQNSMFFCDGLRSHDRKRMWSDLGRFLAGGWGRGRGRATIWRRTSDSRVLEDLKASSFTQAFGSEERTAGVAAPPLSRTRRSPGPVSRAAASKPEAVFYVNRPAGGSWGSRNPMLCARWSWIADARQVGGRRGPRREAALRRVAAEDRDRELCEKIPGLDRASIDRDPIICRMSPAYFHIAP
jgi:hypothetical protein